MSNILKIAGLSLMSLLLFGNHIHAQSISDNQRITQSIFNEIEFHLNQQEADSIYALTGSSFQQSVPATAFRNVVQQQLYPLGRITEAQLLTYGDDDIATYRIGFENHTIKLVLKIDSTNLIETLLFQPYEEEAEASSGLITIPDEPTLSAEAQMDKAVDAIAKTYINKTNTASLAIGILHDGQAVSYFYGETERGNKQLPNAETLFEIGSITKTFTATLLAYLAQQDSLQLDDPITNYLPDSIKTNTYLQAITLQQLANHTSGLPRLPDDFFDITAADALNPYLHYNKEQLYQYLQGYKATVESGTQYIYSNLGYALLGAILSDITGMEYEIMVLEHIASPLAMFYTKQQTDPEIDNLIPVHNEKGAVTPHWDFDIFAPTGGLRSTVGDLLTYAKAHFDMPQDDLTHALAMTRQFTYFHPPETDLGLGWHMNLLEGNLALQHTGGTAGSSSYIAFSPDKKVAVVVLSNAAESVATVGNTLVEWLLKK